MLYYVCDQKKQLHSLANTAKTVISVEEFAEFIYDKVLPTHKEICYFIGRILGTENYRFYYESRFQFENPEQDPDMMKFCREQRLCRVTGVISPYHLKWDDIKKIRSSYKRNYSNKTFSKLLAKKLLRELYSDFRNWKMRMSLESFEAVRDATNKLKNKVKDKEEQCKKCAFFSGEEVLPCAVNPGFLEDPNWLECQDFEEKQSYEIKYSYLGCVDMENLMEIYIKDLKTGKNQIYHIGTLIEKVKEAVFPKKGNTNLDTEQHFSGFTILISDNFADFDLKVLPEYNPHVSGYSEVTSSVSVWEYVKYIKQNYVSLNTPFWEVLAETIARKIAYSELKHCLKYFPKVESVIDL